ncbi:hypothetical protein niasHS_015880 [Heterodera schachtii]|uniref:Uncharacterized protein n=1 Tax=Heterodera schachtii TaxID=97005 RepID=A0ABD2I4P2_HETSC
MIEVQPSLNMSLYKTLEKQPATYAVRKTEIKSSYISVGRYEFEYNVFSSTIPRRVTIALVDNSAFNGDYKMSPFKFDPFDIREISVHAGGMVYPVVPYKLNFSKNYFVRPFVDMYEALGMANSERSFDITMSQFKDGWTFFVIPLNSTLDDSCGFELLRSGWCCNDCLGKMPPRDDSTSQNVPEINNVQQPRQQPDLEPEVRAQIEDAEENLLLNWMREEPGIIRFLFGERRAHAIEAALLQHAERDEEIERQLADERRQQED